MPKILTVGVAVLDIVNHVAEYPYEDSEVRSRFQVVRRGGNATNTAVVLAQLGHDCGWCGVITDDQNAKIIMNDLSLHNINIDKAVTVHKCSTPVSYIYYAE